LRGLVDLAAGRTPAPTPRRMPWATNGPAPTDGAVPEWDRRRLLLTSGALAIGSVVVGSLGRALLEGAHGDQPAALPLPVASLAPAPLAADTALALPGITPIVVPNDDFYRIDTALI